MSEVDYSGVQDVNVPQEAAHAAAIDSQMRRTSTHAAIDDLEVLEPATTITPVGSASAVYAEAEADAAVTAINFLITQGADTEAAVVALGEAVNEILAVLRDAELVPPSEA